MSNTLMEKDLLSQTAIASTMSPDQLRVLCDLAGFKSFQDGEIVMDERDESHKLYVLLEGRASIEGSFEQEISIAETGSVLGELSFLDHKPRSATVRSLGPSRYAVLSQELLNQLRADHPDVLAVVLLNISISLCGKLRSTLRMLNALSASL
jgi:CRP-like cAMP-binding protein